jgi:hypothetical protein
MRKHVLLLLVTLMWPLLANSADFAAGVEAYARGDYATAMREFRPLAQQGHVPAQYNLGRKPSPYPPM